MGVRAQVSRVEEGELWLSFPGLAFLGGSPDSGRHSVFPGGGRAFCWCPPTTSLSQIHGVKEASWASWIFVADAFCGHPPTSKGLWGPTPHPYCGPGPGL